MVLSNTNVKFLHLLNPSHLPILVPDLFPLRQTYFSYMQLQLALRTFGNFRIIPFTHLMKSKAFINSQNCSFLYPFPEFVQL